MGRSIGALLYIRYRIYYNDGIGRLEHCIYEQVNVLPRLTSALREAQLESNDGPRWQLLLPFALGVISQDSTAALSGGGVGGQDRPVPRVVRGLGGIDRSLAPACLPAAAGKKQP